MRNTRMRFLLAVGLALFTIFTSSNFVLLTWNSGIGYVLLVALSGFFGGTVIIDYARSLKLVSGAYIAGCLAVVLLYMLPAIIYGEAYAGETNLILAFTTTELSRNIIYSFPVAIFACLSGCFYGKSLPEDE